ncbi:MAG: ribosome-associated translation inhibitor RaiA [Ignavibacteriae bacterium]|nr:MAG: ribosome-associated translation inhibitor RaiA [Ignavibacteriota bacterium]
MDVHITTRHCQLTDEEHQAAIKGAEYLDRFHHHILHVDVIASEDAGIKNAEFTVKVQGHVVVAKESGDDYVKAIHDAREKVARQLKKLSDRQNDVRSAPLI